MDVNYTLLTEIIVECSVIFPLATWVPSNCRSSKGTTLGKYGNDDSRRLKGCYGEHEGSDDGKSSAQLWLSKRNLWAPMIVWQRITQVLSLEVEHI